MNQSQAIRLAIECMQAAARKKRQAYMMYQEGFADQKLQAEKYIKLCEAMDTLRDMQNVARVEL